MIDRDTKGGVLPSKLKLSYDQERLDQVISDPAFNEMVDPDKLLDFSSRTAQNVQLELRLRYGTEYTDEGIEG